MTIILIASSVSDLRDYKISNHLIIAGWLSGLVFRLWDGGAAGVGAGLGCIAASILVCMLLYLIHAVGAGDIKLFSVICCYHGLAFGVRVGMVSVFLAGILSLIHMIQNKLFFNRYRYFFHYILHGHADVYYDPGRDGRKMVIPMAPVLAAAYYLVLIWTSVLYH